MSPSGSITGCGETAPAAVDAGAEQQVLELVNAERRRLDLSELRRSVPLGAAARLHARDMADEDYVEHDSFDRFGGGLVKSCDWSERLRRFAPDERRLAENIAAGAATPAEVVKGWMESPVHRRNVLGSSYTDLGVGYWPGGRAGFYWVADFGGPIARDSPAGPR